MTDLIFWRHAEAEDFSLSGLDTERALTKRGRKDADKMAKWLNKHLPPNTQVLVSPALRCRETALALHASNAVALTTSALLSVNSSPQQMLSEITTHTDNDALLIVGHQPNLGQVIAKILGLQDTAVSVKKCSVWWLRQSLVNGVVQYRIHTVTLPN